MEFQIESGMQLFSRINQKSDLDGFLPSLFPQGGPHPNEIVEVAGENKYDTLLDFIVHCISPSDIDSTWKNSGAILINTTFHLTIHKIVKYLDLKLKGKNVKNRAPILENALKNLTILNCYDLNQLLLTFHNLENIINNSDNNTLLILDDLGAFYWNAFYSNQLLTHGCHLKSNLNLLQDSIKNLGLVLVFSILESFDSEKYSLITDYRIVNSK